MNLIREVIKLDDNMQKKLQRCLFFENLLLVFLQRRFTSDENHLTFTASNNETVNDKRGRE